MKTRKQKPGFQTATLLAGVIMLLIIFVSAGYILTLPSTEPGHEIDPRLAEIQNQRDAWRQRRPASYEYVVDRSCACGQDYEAPYRVVVTESGTGYRYDGDYGTTANEDQPPEPADIELLFDLVEAALVAGHFVQVFYDTDYGYPAIVRIRQAGQRLDEEYAFDVRDFRIRR